MRSVAGGRAHLIGIGGAGMRSLADVLLGWGWRLAGSDLVGDSARPFAAAGVRIHRGHAAGHLAAETDLVIYSDAVPRENPELGRASELGIPTLSYFQALGRLTSDRHTLAVAGTHGKSTTTAMVAHLLVEAGLDPTVVYGAAPLGHRSGGRAGGGELMLVEACEYRANFLQLAADHAVILGIEPDHFDCYDSLDHLTAAFTRFARSVRDDGLLLARAGCRATEEATRAARCRVETFGFDATADWQARGLAHRRGRYRFGLYRHGRRLAEVWLSVPGRHNVLNALAAAALGWHEGMRAKGIAQALGSFRGLDRRTEVLGSWRGVTLVDDYAHHPTEVKAGLDCLRKMYPDRRVCCVFQPHQALRTARLLDEFAASLQNADRVVVSEVYRAREPAPVFGEVTAADLARRVRSLGGRAVDVVGDEPIAGLLTRELRPGDVLITMGAGDIGKIGHGFIHGLREDRAAG